MVPMCFNFYSGVCAKGKMGPLRLGGGWHILPNSPSVMTLASAKHCVISKTLQELFGNYSPYQATENCEPSDK